MKNAFRLLMVGSVVVAFVACASKKAPEAPAVDSPVAVQPATPTPEATPVVPAIQPLSFEPVYFEYDSYVLTSAAQGQLRTLAGGMKAGGNVKIQIEGHCDERGSNEYNLALGERRARTVKDFLVGEGVGAEALSTISYGEEKPAAQGAGEEAWLKNRRAEIKKN
jgi:peptidoglycan-associated lipoprotein